ncbi:hypothetical protein TNCV_4385941 [Trichonephila clavipes]|nr:hypothetical protein TNCV_4385941 [Trichonephila clavipes]
MDLKKSQEVKHSLIFFSKKLPSKFRRTQAFIPRSIPRLQRSPCRDLAAACAEMPHSFKHSLPDDEQDAFYVLSPPSQKIFCSLLTSTPSHPPPHQFQTGEGKEK